MNAPLFGRRALLAALLVLATGAAAPAAAQDTRADTAAVLLQVAGELQAAGEHRLAESILVVVVRRFGGTPAAAEASQRLAALRRLRTRTVEERQSGETELVVWGTLYGAWLGLAVPLALDAAEPEAIGAGLLAGLPAGFLLSRSYARSRAISLGEARAITFGGSWGTWQGFGWAEVLDLGAEDCDPNFEPCADPGADPGASGRALVASAVAGGLAGIATGAWLGRRGEITPAVATVVGNGALWGTWYGAVLGVLADQDSEDELLATMLLAGDAGLVATALLAPGWNVSLSRARLVNLAGVAGLAGGFALDLLIQPDDDKVLLGIPGLTSALGLWLGARATRGMDSGPEEGGGDGGDAPGPGGLLEVEAGRVVLGMPAPVLTLERRAGADRSAGGERRRLAPVIRLPLVTARF